MNDALAVLAVLLGVTGLLAGFKRLELNNAFKATLGILELAVLGIGIAQLGLVTGLALAGGSVLIGILGWSVYLYAVQESILVDAAIAANAEKHQAERQFKAIWKHRGNALGVLGPHDSARMFRRLCQRGRSFSDIEYMIRPIGVFVRVHRTPIDDTVDSIDQILRRSRSTARDCTKLVDVVTATYQNSVATADEILAGLEAFYEERPAGVTGAS